MKKENTQKQFYSILHASELITGKGIAKKEGRFPKNEDLDKVSDGALVHDGQKILWIGKTKEIPSEYQAAKKINLENKYALMPGLVDAHTHLVFSGNRAQDFARRAGGESYEKIAAEGGGILRTVQATKAASEDELFLLGLSRLRTAYRYGIRTIEIKSGYGLDTETEIKILRVIKRLAQSAQNPQTFSDETSFPAKPMTLVSTFLGAHDFPRNSSREEYLQEIISQMLPLVAKEQLAQFCDVFIDEGFYTHTEGKKILLAAKDHGLKLKIHADELSNTESAVLACELGATSCDHLLKISEKGIQALSQSQTTAVILPGTAFYLKTAQAPAKKMIKQGVRVALSTDFNPGTCPSLNLPTLMTIGALYAGLNAAELFAAVTYNAACALDLQKTKGSLEIGKDADFFILPDSTFEELYYQFAR